MNRVHSYPSCQSTWTNLHNNKKTTVKLFIKFNFLVFALLLCLNALGFSIMNIFSVLQEELSKVFTVAYLSLY